MDIVTLGAVSNREDYIEEFQSLDEDGTAIDLTGATIIFEIRDPETKTVKLSSTTANSKITISTTTATSTLSVTDMRTLCAKEYDVGCTILLNSVTTQLFIGKLPVIDGVVT